MRSFLSYFAGAMAVTIVSSIAPSVASAQEEETGADERQEKAVHEEMLGVDKDTAHYGVGLRFRYVFVPKALIELFIGEASSGVAKPGVGLEFVYRKRDFAIHLGLEHESISPDDGYWLEKGDDPGTPGEYPDFVEFDGFKWTTLDAEFVFHKALAPKFNLRYGAGIGIAIIHGEALQTDSTCPAGVTDIQSQCMEAAGGQQDDPASIPPVFPVVNLLVGAEYRPTDKISINLQGGMRTLFYFGLGGSYFF